MENLEYALKLTSNPYVVQTCTQNLYNLENAIQINYHRKRRKIELRDYISVFLAKF